MRHLFDCVVTRCLVILPMIVVSTLCSSAWASGFIIQSGGVPICTFEPDGDLVFHSVDANGNPTGGVVEGTETTLAREAGPEFVIYGRDDQHNPLVLARVSSTDGKMYIRGELYEDQGGIVLQGLASEFAVRSGNTVVAVVEPDGDLRLVGRVYPRCVVLDAGHGGFDPGAVSPYNPENSDMYNEKHIALNLAQLVRSRLQSFGTTPEDKVRVVLTREGDDYPELPARAKMADRENASCLLSVHFNAQEGPPYPARGTEMVVHIEHLTRQVNLAEDDAFAIGIRNPANSAYTYIDPNASPPIHDPGHAVGCRQTRHGSYVILRDTDQELHNTTDHHPIVAAILELDFLTNSGFHELWNTLEEGETSTEAGRSPDDVHLDVAQAIAEELYEFLDIGD